MQVVGALGLVAFVLAGCAGGRNVAEPPPAVHRPVHSASSAVFVTDATDVNDGSVANDTAAGCCAVDQNAARSEMTLRAIEVPGFESALLYSPTGPQVRPLVVAAHGAGGAPEWECEYWRRLTVGRAFLLCLRGNSLGPQAGFYYRDHHALAREFDAAARLARVLDPRIAPSSGVYAGFSQGATMGSAVIPSRGHAFPFVVLIEGFELWNVPRAQTFQAAGGEGVLLACGSKECAMVARQSAHWIESAGLRARFDYAPGAGHTPQGQVMSKVEAALPWLVGDDPLWHDVLAEPTRRVCCAPSWQP